MYWIQGATVPAGKTLTIGRGAIIKIDPVAAFTVLGTLKCTGASWTSIFDDSLGGDTNGDGAKTAPCNCHEVPGSGLQS